MTALTIKQRAKVNAALCMIHDRGFDADAVTRMAQDIMTTGHDMARAYQNALNSFANDNPDMGSALGKITRLIEASSPATVAQYDSALSQYIESGNDAALVALAPTIALDSIALAIHNGEMTEADVANGGLEMALGFEAGPLLQHAVAAPAEAAISQDAVPFMGLTEVPASPNTNSQLSSAPGAGYVTPKAQAARVHFSGFAPDAPALHDLTPAAAREAARSSATNTGRATFEVPNL